MQTRFFSEAVHDVSMVQEGRLRTEIETVQKPRLEFLDGLRGLAALYVLLFHIHLVANFDGVPYWLKILTSHISFGHYAVCVFIVLSGYCLMLPVARSEDKSL